MAHAERLLHCAIAYREAPVDRNAVVERTFETVDGAVQHMMRVLWTEAHESMLAEVPPPEDTYLCPVDLDTSEPGIVTSRCKTKPTVMRKPLPLPSVTYGRAAGTTKIEVIVPPSVTLKHAIETANRKCASALKLQTRCAERELTADAVAAEKQQQREARKRERDNETTDERQRRKDAAMEVREKKQTLRAKSVNPKSGSVAPKNDSGGSDARVVTLKDVLEDEAHLYGEHAVKSIIPKRVRVKNGKTKYFPSPIPHNRHLTALQHCCPDKSLTPALLSGQPCEGVVIIHGPPGTGKTEALLDLVPTTGRVLICAPTNVAVANIYTRLVNRQTFFAHDCALILPPSRIPPGTPIMSQDPTARVVCCTVSGRSGPILDGHAFDTLLLDEAGQCMEACVWGLLREDVRRIVMVGDTHQLPAVVTDLGRQLCHDRSMMERLILLSYPFTFLSVQRRMHPEIVSFVNHRFYDSALTNDYKAPSHIALEPYYLVEVDSDCKQVGTSFENRAEAIRCIDEACKLKEHFANVVVITPYQAQCCFIISKSENLTVHTVDSFQGQEADAIVLSIVRANECGFWSDYRRLVVALTRARHCLCVVGALKQWTGVLKELADDGVARRLIRA